jgi:predicted acylesterase/phospholipase RssA
MDATQPPPTMRHGTSQPFGPAPPVQRKVINLALQGGGAHGAFTWGVLDRLLDDLELRLMELAPAALAP